MEIITREEFTVKIKKMLEMQDALDQAILKEKALGLTKNDWFALTKTALIVEVSEATNVAEYFKHWKDHRGNKADAGKTHEETLCEEFSDAFHFLLSLINQKGSFKHVDAYLDKYIEEWFDENVFNTNTGYLEYFETMYNLNFNGSSTALFFTILNGELSNLFLTSTSSEYINTLFNFLAYARVCGVTFNDLYEAYMIKNKINYERLESGY